MLFGIINLRRKGEDYKLLPATANFWSYPKGAGLTNGRNSPNSGILSATKLTNVLYLHNSLVYHYSDSSSLEVDAIEQKYSVEYAAFEIKPGTGQIDAAAANLTKLAAVIDTTKTQAPQSLNIITGTEISYRRADGIKQLTLRNE